MAEKEVFKVCNCGRGYSGYHGRWIRLPGAARAQIEASGNIIASVCGSCRRKQEERDK